MRLNLALASCVLMAACGGLTPNDNQGPRPGPDLPDPEPEPKAMAYVCEGRFEYTGMPERYEKVRYEITSGEVSTARLTVIKYIGGEAVSKDTATGTEEDESVSLGICPIHVHFHAHKREAHFTKMFTKQELLVACEEK